jgi:hypothetical protein
MEGNTAACGHCGTENPQGTDFCQHCGRPLTESADEGLRESIEAQRTPEAVRDSGRGLGLLEEGLSEKVANADMPPKD